MHRTVGENQAVETPLGSPCQLDASSPTLKVVAFIAADDHGDGKVVDEGGELSRIRRGGSAHHDLIPLADERPTEMPEGIVDASRSVEVCQDCQSVPTKWANLHW